LACFRLPAAQSASSQRKKTATDQEGVFAHALPAELEEELTAAIAPELVEGVESSLATTRADLGWDELRQSEDKANAVKQTMADLTEFAGPPVGCDQPFCRGSTIVSEEFADDEFGDDDSAALDEEGGESPDHRAQAVYEANGLDFSAMQGETERFLRAMRLRPHEVGSRNFSKWRGRTLWNQCFYLSLAHAYLGQIASTRRVRGLARRMRRAIEAVVLEKHPSWAAGLQASTSGTGKAMVFADFLPMAMRSEDIPTERNLLAKFVVCIMDSVNGHVEVYIGPAYKECEERAEQVRNTLLLWYTPAHYQALVRDDDEGTKLDLTYDEFKQLLVEHGVAFLETIE